MSLWDVIGERWTTPPDDAPEWLRDVYADFEDEIRESTGALHEFELEWEQFEREWTERLLPIADAAPHELKNYLRATDEANVRRAELEDVWNQVFSRFQHARDQAEALARDSEASD